MICESLAATPDLPPQTIGVIFATSISLAYFSAELDVRIRILRAEFGLWFSAADFGWVYDRIVVASMDTASCP
jgi:hypothetical protein